MTCRYWSKLFLLLILLMLKSVARGETPDSISVTLQEVEIVSNKSNDFSRGGSKTFNPDKLLSRLRVMGEADPLNQLKLLPGIRTSSDYGSGFMIDGNTPSQALFRINEVPVFFPYRFGGIFSTFNAPHFKNMTLERGFHKASMPSRLGAKIDFFTYSEVSPRFTGIANIGMTSSEVSLRIPFASKVEIAVSGRISYIDEIYGQWLTKDSDMGYKFWDLNLTALWKINETNSLILNGFANQDRLEYSDSHYAMDNRLKWGNNLVSLSWIQKGTTDMEHRIFRTAFGNNLHISLPQAGLKMPSDIALFGAAGNLSSRVHEGTIKLSYGYELNYYLENSGKVEISGFEEGIRINANRGMKPVEARIYGDMRLPLSSLFRLDAGISTGLFSNSDGYTNFTADPRLSLSMRLGRGDLSIHAGRYSQYVHQVGFSQIGLASDFWITSRKGMPGTRSYDFELDYTAPLWQLGFSATAYCKIIRNEPEYEGQLLNALDLDYNPLDWVNVYNGFNCGLNLNTNIALGIWSGSVGFGFGVARRLNKITGEYFRAASDPGLSVNLEGNCRLNKHWELGANFKYNSGRPYTPAKALFMIGGNLITEYGKQNSASFPSFQQLNISATWKAETSIRNLSLEHLVNLSFINAYGHKNTEIMSYIFDSETGYFKLKKVNSLYRFFPSISYTLKF